MDGLSLIGLVGRDVVRGAMDAARPDAGVARFVMYGLALEEMASIVLAIQSDRTLSGRIDVCLPRYAFATHPGIDPTNLTDDSTTDLRHAECDREGRLLALLDESQGQSLAQIEVIDAGALLSPERIDLWLAHGARSASLAPELVPQWRASVKALVELDRVSMRQVADYLAGVAAELRDGTPLAPALGRALPHLHLPRFDQLFDDLPTLRRTQPSQWRQRYLSHWKRDCFIYKRDQTQVPFSTTKLRDRLIGMSEALQPDVQAVLAAYVEAPPGQGAASFAPFELDWSDVRAFFEEAHRSDSKSIGKETRAFFELSRDDALTVSERLYLDELADERGRNPVKDERDDRFYSDHAAEIRQDARLAALWDRFVFGPEVVCTDLLEGLLRCVRRLYRQGGTGRQLLVVEAVEDAPRAFLALNQDACNLFATRYRGLEAALEGLVTFKRVLAFRHDDFSGEIAARRRGAQSSARKARQLRFKVRMEQEGESGASVRLVWQASLDAVGIGLPGDIERLRDNRARTPLVRCTAGYRRQRTRTTGGVTLANMSGLDPAAQRNRGSFVPASSRCQSLAREWRDGLKEAERAGALEKHAATRIAKLFDTFEQSYGEALDDLASVGARASSLDAQARSYGELLDAIAAEASQPILAERLLRPLMEVGVARVEGLPDKPAAAIICPWHPLRLETQHARVGKLRRAFERLFAGEPISFSDGGGLFFDEMARDLLDPGRPEVAMVWPSTEAVLMAQVDSLNDYGLLEPSAPTPGGGVLSGVDVAPTARQVADLARTYLQLQPHEKDNLSIVLFNCDAATLPQAVVDAVRADAEKDGEDAMCQVVLRHTDEEQLRSIYQQLVQRELQQDGLHASEAARDFMSRLRISLMVNEQRSTRPGEGPPFDIVFCHDVISRQAQSGWSDVPRLTRSAIDIVPAQWSRRRPIGRFDRDAVLHLTCPVQSAPGWSHLDAVSLLRDPELAKAARERETCRVPDRRTAIQSDASRRILEETHLLGHWVVNFDDLLDRRQLVNSGISVIRYKHAAQGSRSLIISSRSSDSLLRAILRGRLRSLDPSHSREELDMLAARLIDDANAVSGDIVLRAAKRGTGASELIGIVLSKYLVSSALGSRSTAWIFLDDYAGWLGQQEGRIADLLCLSPTIGPAGERILDVIVTEAKYVKTSSSSEKADRSAIQLKATLKRLERALRRDGPVDGEIWRARLAEMLQDAMGDDEVSGLDWRTAIRDGDCAIRLAGFSHVFTHGHGELADSASDVQTGILDTETGLQELYSPATLRELVRAYAARRDPTPLRQRLERGGAQEGGLVVGGPSNPAPPAPASAAGIAEIAATPVLASSSRRLPDLIVDPASSAVRSTPANARSKFWDLIAGWAEEADPTGDDQTWLEDVSRRCRSALLRYGMSAALEQGVLTPNAALLRFRGSDDLTVAKVEARRTELETTHGLELIGVRAAPGHVVVSIRRPRRAVLGLPEVWKGWTPETNEANTRLLIAVKEDDGTPLFLEPEPAPHTLVAGSTGSGKSILVQSIVLAIAATNRPDRSRIILIDPKAGVDYFAFEALPHLDGPIIDEEADALARLEGLVEEMQRRYTLFKSARVPNIRAYNRTAPEPLPLLWVVHDEFADWMQVDSYRAGVEAVVNRLGVKARAAGIYLVFAAQRPDNTVFPMQLRSNLGNRLVLRVDSAGTSDLSLGMKNGGAERLLGKGHLAAILGGGTEPVYAQVPFLDEDRLEQLVAALAREHGLGSVQ